MPCCKTAVLVFSQKFQEECACLPEVVQHTEHFDKELIDYCERLGLAVLTALDWFGCV